MTVLGSEYMAPDVGLIGNWADHCIIRSDGDQTKATFQGSISHLTDTGHMSLGQVAAPEGILELWANDAHPIFTITAAHANLYDPQTQYRTDVTDTVKCSMGVDAVDDKFKIYMGEGIGDTSQFVMDTNGGIKCHNSADSATAYQWFDADGGTPVLNIDTTNRRVGIGTATPAVKLDVGGHVILQEEGDGRSAPAADTDPHLRVYSADEAQANDYIELYHDQTQGLLKSPGSIRIDSGNQIRFVATSQYIFGSSDNLIFRISGGNKQAVWGVNDNVGNQLILTNHTKVARPFDHPTQTNPTWYIQSDTDPNDDNTQWLSLAHDQTNAVFGLGSGAYTFPDGSIGLGEPAPETLFEMTSTVPYWTSHNSTEEDADGGRESKLLFKGEQSGGEETTLASITIAHDGAVDDQKGKIDWAINGGTDGDSPTVKMRMLSNGNLGINLTVPTAKVHLPAGTAAAGTAPLKFTAGTALTTPEVGVMEFHNDRFYITNVATRRAVDRTCDVETTTTSVSNTTDETVIFTCPSAVNSYKVGNHLHVGVSGIISNNSAADDITIRTYVGAQLINTYNPAILNLTNADWHVDLTTTIRTIGGAGTIASHGHVVIAGQEDVANELDTIDTTGSNDITITVEWDNAKVDNIISLYQGASHWRN